MKTTDKNILTIIVAGIVLAVVMSLNANAQRRPANGNNAENRNMKSERDRTETVRKNSTFREYDSPRRNSSSSGVSGKREVSRDTRPTSSKATARMPEPTTKSGYSTRSANSNTPESSRRGTSVRTTGPAAKSGYTTRSENSSSPVSSQRGTSVRTTRPEAKSGYTTRSNNSNAPEYSRRGTSVRTTSPDTKSGSMYRNETRNLPSSSGEYTNRTPQREAKTKTYSSSSQRRTTGTDSWRTSTNSSPSKAREIYRLDNHDRRYEPNNNYRGSDRYWSGDRRPGNMNYNHHDRDFYRHYDYRKYNHWDHNWERYRWNLNSWRDYYRGYHPYSFRYHKYYFHHPVYGHVIRKFHHSPVVFVHNHYRYYCYDGHFFRYHRGIGYVLVNMPYGIVFEQLPHDYDRVYINGYLYFRIGNLFLEFTGNGFSLVHYPERYYAWDDNYVIDGYNYEDDLYY